MQRVRWSYPNPGTQTACTKLCIEVTRKNYTAEPVVVDIPEVLP